MLSNKLYNSEMFFVDVDVEGRRRFSASTIRDLVDDSDDDDIVRREPHDYSNFVQRRRNRDEDKSVPLSSAKKAKMTLSKQVCVVQNGFRAPRRELDDIARTLRDRKNVSLGNVGDFWSDNAVSSDIGMVVENLHEDNSDDSLVNRCGRPSISFLRFHDSYRVPSLPLSVITNPFMTVCSNKDFLNAHIFAPFTCCLIESVEDRIIYRTDEASCDPVLLTYSCLQADFVTHNIGYMDGVRPLRRFLHHKNTLFDSSMIYRVFGVDFTTNKLYALFERLNYRYVLHRTASDSRTIEIENRDGVTLEEETLRMLGFLTKNNVNSSIEKLVAHLRKMHPSLYDVSFCENRVALSMKIEAFVILYNILLVSENECDNCENRTTYAELLKHALYHEHIDRHCATYYESMMTTMTISATTSDDDDDEDDDNVFDNDDDNNVDENENASDNNDNGNDNNNDNDNVHDKGNNNNNVTGDRVNQREISDTTKLVYDTSHRETCETWNVLMTNDNTEKLGANNSRQSSLPSSPASTSSDEEGHHRLVICEDSSSPTFPAVIAPNPSPSHSSSSLSSLSPVPQSISLIDPLSSSLPRLDGLSIPQSPQPPLLTPCVDINEKNKINTNLTLNFVPTTTATISKSSSEATKNCTRPNDCCSLLDVLHNVKISFSDAKLLLPTSGTCCEAFLQNNCISIQRTFPDCFVVLLFEYDNADGVMIETKYRWYFNISKVSTYTYSRRLPVHFSKPLSIRYFILDDKVKCEKYRRLLRQRLNDMYYVSLNRNTIFYHKEHLSEMLRRQIHELFSDLYQQLC